MRRRIASATIIFGLALLLAAPATAGAFMQTFCYSLAPGIPGAPTFLVDIGADGCSNGKWSFAGQVDSTQATNPPLTKTYQVQGSGESTGHVMDISLTGSRYDSEAEDMEVIRIHLTLDAAGENGNFIVYLTEMSTGENVKFTGSAAKGTCD